MVNEDDRHQKPAHYFCSQQSWRQKGATKPDNGNKAQDTAAMLGDRKKKGQKGPKIWTRLPKCSEMYEGSGIGNYQYHQHQDGRKPPMLGEKRGRQREQDGGHNHQSRTQMKGDKDREMASEADTATKARRKMKGDNGRQRAHQHQRGHILGKKTKNSFQFGRMGIVVFSITLNFKAKKLALEFSLQGLGQ